VCFRWVTSCQHTGQIFEAADLWFFLTCQTKQICVYWNRLFKPKKTVWWLWSYQWEHYWWLRYLNVENHRSHISCMSCRLVVKRYALKQSVLEDVMEEPPVSATDPLNGACQLGKTQPSPFSSRKVMYENEEVSYAWVTCWKNNLFKTALIWKVTTLKIYSLKLG